MTAEARAPRSAQWQSVDGAADPDSFVAYLDRGAAILRQSRMDVMRLLELGSGCSVLDVGSGAGEFLIEAAGSNELGRAVGIDISEAMVNTATSRARAAGVAVLFALGNAERLPFPADSFDRVNCSRVLLHLESPGNAIAEMARVLVPGGRMAIVEPDFDAMMIDSDDLNISRAVRSRLAGSLRNPDIGRRLRRLLMDSGLDVMQLDGVASPVTNLQMAVDLFHLLDHLDRAVELGEVSVEQAAEWRRQIETADAAARIFIAPVLFQAIATKPPNRLM